MCTLKVFKSQKVKLYIKVHVFNRTVMLINMRMEKLVHKPGFGEVLSRVFCVSVFGFLESIFKLFVCVRPCSVLKKRTQSFCLYDNETLQCFKNIFFMLNYFTNTLGSRYPD